MAIEARGDGRGQMWRVIGWGLAAMLLALPFVAMQFTSEVAWGVEDFVFAAVMLGIVGLLLELTVRKANGWSYRLGAAAAIGAAFLTVWINAAVGMIGSEDNIHNLLFLAIIVVVAGGAMMVRFRADGMAKVMTLAALLQGSVALAGMASDPLGAQFSLAFMVPWLVSAGLFHLAAKPS